MKCRKHVICAAVILLALAILLTGCGANDRAQKRYSVELLMPGNTVVIGECDYWKFRGEDIVEVCIDGRKYYASLWRVVLKELDSE